MLIPIKLLLTIDALLVSKLSLVSVYLLQLGELLFFELDSSSLVLDQALLFSFNVLLLLGIFGL